MKIIKNYKFIIFQFINAMHCKGRKIACWKDCAHLLKKIDIFNKFPFCWWCRKYRSGLRLFSSLNKQRAGCSKCEDWGESTQKEKIFFLFSLKWAWLLALLILSIENFSNIILQHLRRFYYEKLINLPSVSMIWLATTVLFRSTWRY